MSMGRFKYDAVGCSKALEQQVLQVTIGRQEDCFYFPKLASFPFKVIVMLGVLSVSFDFFFAVIIF